MQRIRTEHRLSYKIIFTSDPSIMGDPDRDSQYCYGLVDPLRQVIYIRAGLQEARKRATLYHELMHMAMDAYGISDGTGVFTEEDVCRLIGAWADILRVQVDRIMADPEVDEYKVEKTEETDDERI